MIGIRVDSNKNIGLGHVMRCLSIAEASKNRDKILFIVCDNECEKIIKNRNFNCIKLLNKYDDLNNEVYEIKKIIYKYKISKLLIDSYFVTDYYFKALKEVCKIIYINDFLEFRYDVDAIINYNIFSEYIEYSKYYKNNQIFKGTKYVPLNKVYENISYVLKRKVKNILITTGGTDINNINRLILNRIIEDDNFKNINFNIIIGKYFNITDEEKENYNSYSNINLLENVDNISKIIKESDIVISAAGFTMYEICSIGVPCILLSNGSDLAAKSFLKKKSIIYGGDCNNLDLDVLIKKIYYLINNFEIRKKLNKNSKNIIDKKGSYRILDIINNI